MIDPLFSPFISRLILLASLLIGTCGFSQTPINRKALVLRHSVILTKADTLASLSVGNGAFAFTVDVTGLQSFPEVYAKGIPLGIQAEWGWHSFPNPNGFRFDEALKSYKINGRKITYAVQWPEPGRKKDAVNWLRQNPHRLQLGNLGLEILKKDGSRARLNDLQNIHQELNLWSGEIRSHFTVDDEPVDVLTYAHQEQDLVAVQVHSSLIRQGRLKIRLRFPYPTGEFLDEGVNWTSLAKHTSAIVVSNMRGAIVRHTLDTTSYTVALQWNNQSSLKQIEPHYFILTPDPSQETLEFRCLFTAKPKPPLSQMPTYAETQANSRLNWQEFWSNGGAVDFEGSTDPRSKELERRIVLSQYLTKIQCTGSQPPQETGLTYNSWFGKPHLEMHWWHGVHFALWNRIGLLKKSLPWYGKVSDRARQIAHRQGFKGLRWQKMTDPYGKEAPSSVGAFLIWQQPHFIYFAELAYRHRSNRETLNQYKALVFASADFMASYAFYDSIKGCYILGKGLIPAQERFDPVETFNPTFELAYWHWALSVAQQWRLRSGMPRNRTWDEVLNKLSPLPVKEAVYLAAESAPDSYTREAYMTDHPTVLGAYGILPSSALLDTATMQRTFDKVWLSWKWNDTWGWDFPMVAMTATRLGKPEKAIDALLMDIRTNTYLPNGHNYQDERLRLYLPGNGGLLTAIAMMCAGYDGCSQTNPGIPKNGQWKVRWEGLKKMP